MFESFYASFWHSPLLLWVFPLLFLALARPDSSFFGRAVVVFVVLSIIDPLMTGPVTEWLGLGGASASAVMIAFVLLGDFRFFFFVEYAGASQSRGARAALARAGAWTLVVPVVQAILIRTLPHLFENVRHTFLVYELLFLLLAIVLKVWVLPRRELEQPVRDWLSSLCTFAMTYYALWAAADVVILAGLDVGYLIRVVPNVLYYGLFIPFVFWKAPFGVKEGRR